MRAFTDFNRAVVGTAYRNKILRTYVPSGKCQQVDLELSETLEIAANSPKHKLKALGLLLILCTDALRGVCEK